MIRKCGEFCPRTEYVDPNAAYLAIDEALADVREGEAHLVPDHLRDRHRPGADTYPDYKYPHDFPDAKVEQQYLPDGRVGHAYYRPAADIPRRGMPASDGGEDRS